MMRKVFALVVSLGAAGCASSNYRPADSPLVSRAWEAGGLAYYRDGRKYDRLVDAVDGNAQAVAEARTARTLDTWATAFILGGLGTEITGFAMIGAGETDSVKAAGGGLVLASLGALIAGIWVASYSVPHQQDAINIYNDGVFRGGMRPSPSIQEPASRPASRER
jgi:hypothetical protein